MYNKLKKERIQAMKNKDVVAKSLYSTFLGEVETEAKKKMVSPDNSLVESVAKKMAKNIENNIEIYSEKGVDVTNEKRELELVNSFLPKILSDEKTAIEVKRIISDLNIDNLKQQGKIMGTIKKEFGNSVDMSLVSKLVRDLLS